MGISIVIDAAIRIQLTFREIGSPNQGYTGLLLLGPVGANPDALPGQDLVHRDRTLSIPPLGLSSFKECLGQLRNKDSKIWIRQLRCIQLHLFQCHGHVERGICSQDIDICRRRCQKAIDHTPGAYIHEDVPLGVAMGGHVNSSAFRTNQALRAVLDEWRGKAGVGLARVFRTGAFHTIVCHLPIVDIVGARHTVGRAHHVDLADVARKRWSHV
mmetsp:Transcript_132376/g.313820  ORF Transcript_132376/g.313820 Transcript_132376/m.313820 type:complete len:214 (-) Transcript_132376:529-1170(-)